VAGGAFEFRLLAQCMETDRRVYAFDPPGIDGMSMPQTSVAEMVETYLQEMRSVQPTGPYFMCGISLGGVVAYEMAVKLSAAGETVGMVGMIDTAFPPVNDPRGLHHTVKSTARRVMESAYRRYVEAGRRVPERLRHRCTRALHGQAGYSYRPGHYAGKLTYFRAVNGDDDDGPIDRGWSRVVDAVDVVCVDGPHYLLEEPHVRNLARAIDDRLRSIPPS
jgi:thioesterase domain-containing protein